MTAAGLRHKDHFDELLGALNPNIGLPTDIASQIVDSAYFTRFLGADLGDAHAAHTAAEDQERAVKAAAAERGAPLQERCNSARPRTPSRGRPRICCARSRLTLPRGLRNTSAASRRCTA